MDEPPTDPYVPFLMDLTVADEVAEAGVLAICAQLVKKGVFDRKDVASVLRHMREAIDGTDAENPCARRCRSHLEAREADLFDLIDGPDIRRPPADR